jgi:alanyl aminopeptidase
MNANRTLALLCLMFATCAAPERPAPVAPPPPPAAPEPPPSREPPRLRLPGTVRPVRYQAELTVLPDSDAFSGVIDIQLTLSAPTALIWLNGSELKVRTAHLQAGGERIAAEVVSGGEEFIGFLLPRRIAAGEATLHIAYEGPITRKDDIGLFRQQEAGTWYAFTDFEPADARRVFPCFDEPSYKVPWQLSLRVQRGHVALANTPQIGESDAGGGLKLVRFAESEPLPTYLVAFAVGPFELVDAGRSGRKGTPVRIITPRGKAAEARYAKAATPEILAVLEEYFGSPYPYEKLDLIAVPLKNGAMENPGLVTFRESIILASEKEETVRFQRGFGAICAHELAHQWFGNLVTMAFWDDIWLNESFASWMETKVLMKWRPQWQEDVNDIAGRGHAMSEDSLITARRIRQPIESKHDIRNAFDSITYGKGSAVLTMFDAYIGPEVFRKGVQQYLARHTFGNATAADFLGALSQAAGQDIAASFATFLDQPGVPLLRVSLTCDKGQGARLALRQERYLPVGSAGAARASEQTWRIPVCARYGKGKETYRSCTLLQAPAGELPLKDARECPEWVLANAGETGYYRVLHEGDLLKRLQRPTTPLTLAERVGLIDDVAALMRTGQLPAAEALQLAPTLVREKSRHLVQAAAKMTFSVHNLVPDPLWPNYQRLARKVFTERARALGFRVRPGDDEDTRLLRGTLLSLAAGLGEEPGLASEARGLAQRWLKDRAAVDADLVGITLAVAARQGDRALFDAYLAEARRTPERKDRMRLLGNLGHFRDPAIVEEALQVLLSKDFDIRESFGLLGNAIHERKSRALAYDFLKQNFDALVARMPKDRGAHVPPMVASAFCDQAAYDDVKAFFTSRAARFTGGPRELDQALEELQLCIALRQAQEKSLTGFLKKF